MQTSNLWHVQQLAVAPTFQVRENNQPQTKNLTKTLESFYFSCAFLGSFIWYHPQLKPSPEGVQLYASPWLYLLFFLFCGILELCIAPRTELEVHPGTDLRCVTSTRVWTQGCAGICLSLSQMQHPLELSTLGHSAGMQESPWGCQARSADLPQTNPAEKGSPTGVPPPLPNLLVPFYITLYRVCQVEGGGDSSSRTEQHPEAER